MNDKEILKDTFYSPTEESLIATIDYLTRLSIPVYKESHRREFIFKTRWKEKEFEKRDKCHVQSALVYLSENKESLEAEQIKITIADLSYFLKRLKVDQDFDFLLGNTNTVPIVINFKIAQNIFSKHQIPDDYKNSYSSGTLSIYAVRLALEQRIRGLLGIDFVESNNRPVGLSSLISIAKNLKSVEYHESLNWNQVELVNKWINHFMHRTLRPHPWTIYESLTVLQPLIDPKFPIWKEGRKYRSWNNAAFVIDPAKYKKEVEIQINEKFSRAQIQWALKPEVTIKK